MVANTLEAARIVVFCVLAAVVYGVVHDQVTARICPEYFTVGHVDVGLRNPTLIGLFWGIVATWWVGAILGGLLALVSRAGPEPRLDWRQHLRRVGAVMAVAGLSAMCAGLVCLLCLQLGWVWPTGVLIERVGSEEVAKRFLVDAWMHVTSYAVAALGGIAALGSAVAERVSGAKAT